MLKKCILATSSVAILSLTGCSSFNFSMPSMDWLSLPEGITDFVEPYRPDVHQGNLVTNEQVEQLHVGMTQMQVQFLLGVPLLRDMFHQNRWDYVYYVNPRGGESQKRRLTVFFDESGRLAKYEYTAMPSETQADQMILGHETDFDTKAGNVTSVDQASQTKNDIERNAAL